MNGEIATGPGWELRFGRWQDVLGDVQGDALITDPPYSEKTHRGHDDAVSSTRLDGEEKRLRVDRRNGNVYSVGVNRRKKIKYHPWTPRDVAELVSTLQVNGWRVALTDHVLQPHWEASYLSAGLYAFAPLPYVAVGSRVRLAGDGPSMWSLPVMVARPKHRPYSNWGTLDGAYILPKGQSEQGTFIGGKPLWLMRALVRDYSRPGDFIVDPCAGSGTTLLAAVIEGRRAIGAEMDEATFELAVKRLEKGFTPSMFVGANERAEQLALDSSDE